MAEEKLICPICGEPTRVYMGNARKDRLCGKHADMLKKEEIKILDDGAIIKTNGEVLYSPKKEISNCIVCGTETKTGFLCRDCYYEMKDFMDSFDKNKNGFELKDYYYNLKQNIYRMRTFDYVQSNCNKLIALSNLVKSVHGDTSLSDRVVKDVEELISSKKPKAESKDIPEIITKDAQKEELIRTMDGHRVKSQGEQIVDDILYELGIVHCYEKKVPIELDESAVYCDWFIPVNGTRQGIYVEYWGMSTKEYLANKDRKLKIYGEKNIPLIQIQKDDVKDPQGLSDRLLQEINKLAKDRFNRINFIQVF